jgi:hypothetical protein
MALLDDIKAALIAQGVGVSDTTSAEEWPIFLGSMPDGQDQAITILELPGDQPESIWRLDHPAFQVMVRGKPYEYNTARTKLQEAFEALHASEENLTGSDYVVLLASTSGPISLGNDDNFRPRLLQAFNVTKNR